ncbi:MAG: GNAT family N-acetyltransferase [Deinococcota bacterium]
MCKPLSLTLTLTTPRLKLRAPSSDDIPHIFEATRTAGFNDGMLWDPPATIDELQEPLRRNLEQWRQGRAYTFSFIRTKDEVFIGRISLRQTDVKDVWDVGYFCHPKHQGQGYTTEALAAVLELGFTQLSATHIEAWHATWNVSSRRVLEKLGMHFVEHLPEGFQKHGKWVAEDRLSISKADWQARTTLM